jgi:hypothetical protein
MEQDQVIELSRRSTKEFKSWPTESRNRRLQALGLLGLAHRAGVLTGWFRRVQLGLGGCT